MHYSAYVLIPGEGDVDELVAEAMSPYDENRDVEQVTEDGETYWHNPVGFWDWYQIGGRWTGQLSGYDPDSDPSLLEVCNLCQGTGQRNDEAGRSSRAANPDYTCNGCDGKGKHPVWPTQRPRHDGDIQDALVVLPSLTEDKTPFSFIVHGSESVAHRERYVPGGSIGGGKFVEDFPPDRMLALIYRTIAARREAGHEGDRLVVVDYHS